MLGFHAVAWRRSRIPTVFQRTSCAHIRASCLLPGNGCDSRHTRAPKKSFVLAFYSLFGHWHCACTLISQRGQALVTKMDSAANQFGAPESVNQRGIFPLLVASGCPSRIRRISKQESDYENR